MTDLHEFRFNSWHKEDFDVYSLEGKVERLCLHNLPSQVKCVEWSALTKGGLSTSAKAIDFSYMTQIRLTHLDLYAVMITRENVPAFREALRFLRHLSLFRVKMQTSIEELRSADTSDPQKNFPAMLESMEVHFGQKNDSLAEFLFPNGRIYQNLKKLHIWTWIANVRVLNCCPNIEHLELSRDDTSVQKLYLLPSLSQLKNLGMPYFTVESARRNEILKHAFACFPRLESYQIGNLKSPPRSQMRIFKQHVLSQ
jgi:hypothetical protein